MMRKITFNKLSVILMYIMVIGLPVICILLKEYPPDAFLYCWFGFWVVQAIITAKLRISKRKREEQTDILDIIETYINEDNISEVSERLLGVKLTPKKSKKKSTKTKDSK